MQSLLKQIKDKKISVNTSTVADVLDSHGIHGVLNHKLKRLSGCQTTVIGHAYTVDWKPVRKKANIMASQASTWDQVKNFLVPEITHAEGLVYVAGSGELLTSAALAGGMSSTHFENLGFEGMVLGGATRDANTLSTLNIPVIASNFTPTDTQGSYLVATTGTATIIDNIPIKTGDLIISDMTGTVCIPKSLSKDVLLEVMEIDLVENEILSSLSTDLFSIIENKGRI